MSIGSAASVDLRRFGGGVGRLGRSSRSARRSVSVGSAASVRLASVRRRCRSARRPRLRPASVRRRCRSARRRCRRPHPHRPLRSPANPPGVDARARSANARPTPIIVNATALTRMKRNGLLNVAANDVREESGQEPGTEPALDPGEGPGRRDHERDPDQARRPCLPRRTGAATRCAVNRGTWSPNAGRVACTRGSPARSAARPATWRSPNARPGSGTRPKRRGSIPGVTAPSATLLPRSCR